MSEFDSVAGWQPARPEPDVVAYGEEAERLPFPVRALEWSGLDVALTGLFGIEPRRTKVASPSSFARERMLCFAEDAVADRHRTALAVARLSWVLDGDPHPLNQIIAVHGLEILAADVGLDPLQQDLGPVANQSDEAIARAWQPHVLALRDVVTELAHGREPEPQLRDACVAAIAEVEHLVPPSPRDRRGQMLLLNYLAHRTRDPAIVAPAEAALDLVMRRLAADSLRRALYEPRSPAVRDAAVRACCALGGLPAVPRILRLVTSPRASGGIPTAAELDRDVRLTLVRLCGQLPEQVAMRAEPGGPAPVEFLYDVIADGGADRALQVAALEALACCLGRPVDLDRTWADRWWADYVVNRRARG
ncbi:MAG TPA: hypothetical protein VK081_13475 [Planctomycetota bacterium]|nr:hypothetical protein [Planctomycetota bacterium]